MTKHRKLYSFFQKASAIFLMLTLFWLTVSTPFIITTQQQLQQKQQKSVSVNLPVTDEEEDGNTSNNVDEKAPGTNLSEEFLHEHHPGHTLAVLIDYNHGHKNCGIYIAYHGELHAPPPNVA